MKWKLTLFFLRFLSPYLFSIPPLSFIATKDGADALEFSNFLVLHYLFIIIILFFLTGKRSLNYVI